MDCLGEKDIIQMLEENTEEIIVSSPSSESQRRNMEEEDNFEVLEFVDEDGKPIPIITNLQFVDGDQFSQIVETLNSQGGDETVTLAISEEEHENSMLVVGEEENENLMLAVGEEEHENSMLAVGEEEHENLMLAVGEEEHENSMLAVGEEEHENSMLVVGEEEHENLMFVVCEEEHENSMLAVGEEEHENSNRHDVAEEGLSFSLDLNEGMPITDKSHGNELDNQFIVLEVSAEENQLLVSGNDTEGNDVTNQLPIKKLTRKRLSKPENWKRNIRKVKFQAGEEYVSAKGKTVKAKTLTIIKKDCLNTCKMKCSRKITNDERQAFFSSFYKLKSQNEKTVFIANNTQRYLTVRPKESRDKDHDATPPKRVYSFKYYFTVKGTKIQVCKSFFLSTLQISQKPVYNAHKNKDPTTGYPKPDERGAAKGHGIPEYAKYDVRKHINSFPVVESHYCRSDTNKLYLESSLNIKKMYGLFKEKYPESVVKESMYRFIFNTEYNYGFHVPKKDRCDLCEERKVALREKFPFDEEKYTSHIAAKTAMREERANDMDKEQNDVPVLSFDLENVITCPQAEISSLFYYSKLSLYNLTAHLQTKTSKTVYCAIWPETMSGRTGNDLASAVYKIMCKVLEENPLFDRIITWSDSCVPQNKNQMMSGAMMLLLKEHPQLKSITMKYSTAGHGAVQVVDNIHSQIEKAMKATEFYSPVGFLRILKKISPKQPYVTIQMSNKDFLNFAESSKVFNFTAVPFTKVCSLKFTQTLGEIEFKEVHSGPTQTVDVKPLETPRSNTKTRKKSTPERTNHQIGRVYQTPKVTKYNNQQLKPKKVHDIILMKKFMPQVDRDYFDAILQNQKNGCVT